MVDTLKSMKNQKSMSGHFCPTENKMSDPPLPLVRKCPTSSLKPCTYYNTGKLRHKNFDI